jgi:hypothetical protein
MMRSGIIAIVAGLALTACASTTDTASTPSEGRDCFRADDVSGYGIVDNNHVRLTVSPNRSYIAETMFNARDLDWTHAIAIRSTTSFICTGATPGVDLIGGEPERRYAVRSIVRAPDDPPAIEGS